MTSLPKLQSATELYKKEADYFLNGKLYLGTDFDTNPFVLNRLMDENPAKLDYFSELINSLEEEIEELERIYEIWEAERREEILEWLRNERSFIKAKEATKEDIIARLRILYFKWETEDFTNTQFLISYKNYLISKIFTWAVKSDFTNNIIPDQEQRDNLSDKVKENLIEYQAIIKKLKNSKKQLRYLKSRRTALERQHSMLKARGRLLEVLINNSILVYDSNTFKKLELVHHEEKKHKYDNVLIETD